MMILHSVLPHIHHSHQFPEEKNVDEVAHHSHDSDEDHSLFSLLLNSHAHNPELENVTETFINYNKIFVGKNLPIIILLSQQLFSPDIVVVSEKKNFHHKQDYKQEHHLLNCPLRAPPTLG
jgi:hypothetical protein